VAVAVEGSARSVLLTVLGDVVRPHGNVAWLGALQTLLEDVGVVPATTRQALRRLVAQHIVEGHRHGRRALYAVTDAGAARLEEAAERIYQRRPPAWDGRWRLLTYTFEEDARTARDGLRRELGWLGYGSVGTSTHLCPWDRGERLGAALDKHAARGAVTTFTAEHHGDDGELTARAYDLPALRDLHARFLEEWAAHDPEQVAGLDPADALALRVALVHAWRRSLFLDPGLPQEVVPDDWLGDEAAALFGALHAALRAPGDARWRELTEEQGAGLDPLTALDEVA